MNKQNSIQNKIETGVKEILNYKEELSDKFTDDKVTEMCISHVWGKDSEGGQKKKLIL